MEFPEQSLEPIGIEFSEEIEHYVKLFQTFKFDFLLNNKKVLKSVNHKQKLSETEQPTKKFNPKRLIIETLTPTASFSFHKFEQNNGEAAFKDVKNLLYNSAPARLALGILIGVVKFKNEIKVLEWEEIII